MSRHDFALILYGVGLIALIFALIRTYYQVWKIKKETSQPTRGARSKTPPSSPSEPLN